MKKARGPTTRSPELAMILAIVLVLDACAPTMIEMDKQQLGRLKDEPEIQFIGYPPPTPSDCSWIRSKHWDTTAFLIPLPVLIGIMVAGKSCLDEEKEQYIDPLPRARDRFAQAVKAKLALENARMKDEILADDDPDFLRQRLGSAAVLDFKVTRWELVTPGSARYRVPSALRGRLLRLADPKILWQGLCELSIGAATPSTGPGPAAGSETDALTKQVEDWADRCVNELLEQFLGKEIVVK